MEQKSPHGITSLLAIIPVFHKVLPRGSGVAWVRLLFGSIVAPLVRAKFSSDSGALMCWKRCKSKISQDKGKQLANNTCIIMEYPIIFFMPDALTGLCNHDI